MSLSGSTIGIALTQRSTPVTTPQTAGRQTNVRAWAGRCSPESVVCGVCV